MARRNRTSPAEDLFDLFHVSFMYVPSWVCLPIALLVFGGIKLWVAHVSATVAVFGPVIGQFGNLIAGAPAAIILMAGLTALLGKQRRRELYEQQKNIDSIRKLSWREFELFVGEAYRRQEYQVSETGGGGADDGIDLKLHRNGETVLVQCKQWKAYKPGGETSQGAIRGADAERATRAIFVTSGVFTKDAWAFAQGKPLELIDGASLTGLIPSTSQPVTPDLQQDVPTKTLQAVVPISEPQDMAPICPLCESPMVLRAARRGPNAGSQFWGCSKYPRCTGKSNHRPLFRNRK